jgi:type II secretory pathway pseudopilin PulG
LRLAPKQPRPRLKRHQRRGAFTLVEASVSVVLVGVLLVAAMTVAARSAQTRYAQKDMTRGLSLARQLLAEIVQDAYEQPGVTTTTLGPESGETRATFNDVDDFNGWVESPPADATGIPIPGFAGWSRAVKVEWVTPLVSGNTFNPSAVETGLKRITVTVTAPSGQISTAVALRSRQSMYDKPAGAQEAYTSWIGVSMQIGNDATTTAAGGANPLNQVP